jgi:diamine N-acetyltransferase
MSDRAIGLRAPTRDDLPWIVALERNPTNARLLCAWSPERHGAGLVDPDKRYLVFEDAAGVPCGFAILAGACRRGRAIELVRIAVDPPGQGLGTAALRRLIEHVFGPLRAKRLFLDVFDDNERARHAYRGLGFREEEIRRDAARRQDGTMGTLVIMGMAAGARPAAKPKPPTLRSGSAPVGRSAV